jgi:hypothetical protein
MDNDVLFNYVDRRIYRAQFAELSHNPELVQSSVGRIVKEQVSKLESLHAAPEIKRAISLGRDPEDIIIQADRLVSRGLTPAQVNRQLHNQNEFLAYCAREYHGGDVMSLRASMRVAEDIEGAAVNGYIMKQFERWQADNPGKAAEMTLLSRWENQAKVHVARQWNRFMNRP